MASVNLGRVGFVLRGTYNSSTAYKQLDVVYYNGSTYVAKINITGISPGNPSAWQEMTGIASAVASGIANSAVRFDTTQNLTGQEKNTALLNIGAAPASSIGTIQSEVSNLSGQVSVAEGKVSTIEGEMETIEGQIATLQTDLSGKITVSGTKMVVH